MSSYVDMSLDDIIKKKREETREKRSKVRPQNFKPVPKKAPIIDARYKIISKNRSRITDAREKLTQIAKQKDARFKLNKLHQETATVSRPVRSTFPRQGIFARAPPATQSEFEYRSKPTQTAVWSDLQKNDEDPMDEEYVPQPLSIIKRKFNMQYNFIAEGTDGCTTKVAAMQRTVVADKEKTPQTLPELIPIPNKLAMATLRSEIIAKKIEVKPRLEYRIIVSNLNSTVTGEDIQELFGDVSLMMESRLVRPGIAEVIYQTQRDAQAAVDLYHSRHLDGQPMNCLLVTPKLPSTGDRSCYNEEFRPNLNVQLNISTVHKALFRN